MVKGEGHPHVDHVGNGHPSLVAAGPVKAGVRQGFRRKDRLAPDQATHPGSQACGVGTEYVGQRCLIGTAAPAGDGLDHGGLTLRLRQRNDILGQRHHPHRQADLIPCKAMRQAVSIPEFMKSTKVLPQRDLVAVAAAGR